MLLNLVENKDVGDNGIFLQNRVDTFISIFEKILFFGPVLNVESKQVTKYMSCQPTYIYKFFLSDTRMFAF